MNTENYSSLEASKRLVSSGIVLETEAYWMLMLNGTYELVHCSSEVMKEVVKQRAGSYPAPSMAEVWRGLPSGTDIQKQVGRTYGIIHRTSAGAENDNPTDALIDLLIWVRKEKKDD